MRLGRGAAFLVPGRLHRLELKHLAIYGAKLRRGYFGFQIQLVRSPKTLERHVFRNAASQFILIFKCNRPGGWVRSRTVSTWGEFVAAADPAANLRQGRPTDWASPSFSSHHEAARCRPRREARASCHDAADRAGARGRRDQQQQPCRHFEPARHPMKTGGYPNAPRTRGSIWDR